MSDDDRRSYWEWRWSPRRRDDWSFESLVLRYVGAIGGLFLASEWVPGIAIDDAPALLIGAAILSAVNLLVRPVLSAITCLLQILTLGIFTLILNALMLALTAWAAGKLDVKFSVDGFWAAVFGALLVSVVTLVLTGPVRRLISGPT